MNTGMGQLCQIPVNTFNGTVHSKCYYYDYLKVWGWGGGVIELLELP